MDIRKINLSQAACYCGIQAFYDLIAKQLGYDPEKVVYDCTKIDVSKSVQDQIFAFYKNDGASLEAISQAWVCYGPKTSLTYDDCVAEVKPEFIQEAPKS